MNILEVIKEHGLALRQIPKTVVSVYEVRHFKEGDEVIIRHGRDMAKRTTTPNNAGYWMCKPISHNGATVIWNIETDNLAPTLEQSVQRFLDSQS